VYVLRELEVEGESIERQREVVAEPKRYDSRRKTLTSIIYGIGALDDANVFVGETRFILDDLNTLGWVLIVLGVFQLTGGFSLLAGNVYGRVIGVIAGSLGALGALLSIGGDRPWWSLCVFALCIYVVHGLIVFGEEEERVEGGPRGTGGAGGAGV
jgi:hypothetical protein